MKSFKIMGFGARKSKSGFTLIELLIVMVIIAILAGVIVMAVGGVFGTAKSTAYSTAREQIQTAVGAYAAANSGNVPTFGGAANTSIMVNTTIFCTVLNMSALLTTNPTGGTLRAIPDGTYASGAPATATDSCGGNTSIANCKNTNHYIWYLDNGSSVYSTCTLASLGTGTCGTYNNTGFAGVWP